MQFHPLMRTTWVGWSPEPPSVVADAVRDAVDVGQLRGTAGEQTFRVSYVVPNVRNSWRPVMKGTLQAQGGGTLVEVSLGVHEFVLVFTIIHSVLMFGIGWLMGVAAFSWEVDKATGALRDVCGVTLEGEEALDAGVSVADPTRPGAEASPPYSLGTRADGERVRFVLRGGPTARVEVDLAWVTVTQGPGEPVRLSWDELQRVEVEGGEGEAQLMMRSPDRTVGVPAREHPIEHLEWLAAYLTSRAERWRGSATEQAEADEARRAMGRLQRDAVPD